MNFMSSFKALCTPAQLYFAISFFVILMALFRRVRLNIIFVKFIFVLLWTFILGWLCKKGYASVSWFLVLLPYVIMLLTIFNFAIMNREGMEEMKESVVDVNTVNPMDNNAYSFSEYKVTEALKPDRKKK